MKQKINKFITVLLLAVTLVYLSSCSKDFLNVVDPTVLDEAIYPKEIKDFEKLMNDLYGRVRDHIYGQNIRSLILADHSYDSGYNGADFNEFCLIDLRANLGPLGTYWNNMFTHIAKCNDFLIKLDALRQESTLSANNEARAKTMEAEARFWRAFCYFHLVNIFGEEPILTTADLNKMGVPLWTDLAKSIPETYRARSTQGEIYNQVISDLEAAVPLLAGQGKINGQAPRIDEWAAKTLLAKTYMFTLQWGKAAPVLKDIIDNGGHELVSYDIYRNMYGGHNKYNKESIFEINYSYDPQTNNQSGGVGSVYPRYGSVAFWKNGGEVINGFSNFYIHAENIPRFGFSFPNDNDPEVKQSAAYRTYSLGARQDKSVDPRLYVSSMEPYIDSININDGGGWYQVIKARFEGYPIYWAADRAWNGRKYTLIDAVYSQNTGVNMYVFRLAEVYLLYAEALIESGGDQALALEYINKVHRRAYDQPVDTPSSYDYASLTDRTKTVDPTDHLANDVLKYERWAETFNEGGWWYDVRRWDIGQQEADYYKRSNCGPLVFSRRTTYAWPIPQAEMENNSLMVQNPR